MITKLTEIALGAGPILMEYWRQKSAVQTKLDLSPVTIADEKSEKHIISHLHSHYPNIPIVAEEAASRGEIGRFDDRVFYVDPLDGTKEFINERPEFTINIALVEKGIPKLGIVYAPALGLAYVGSDEGAFKLDIEDGSIKNKSLISAKCEEMNKGLIVIGSASHESEETKEFLNQFSIRSYEKAGSSLKFCLLAEGKAHLYPRLGRTMMWDTAAGHAVLLAAGGKVTLIDGLTPLTYLPQTKTGADPLANPHFLALCQELELGLTTVKQG
jgi:3'(2'), 5'-bisphosphate nucleotidase